MEKKRDNIMRKRDISTCLKIRHSKINSIIGKSAERSLPYDQGKTWMLLSVFYLNKGNAHNGRPIPTGVKKLIR
jgi:hypothetical protein